MEDLSKVSLLFVSLLSFKSLVVSVNVNDTKSIMNNYKYSFDHLGLELKICHRLGNLTFFRENEMKTYKNINTNKRYPKIPCTLRK